MIPLFAIVCASLLSLPSEPCVQDSASSNEATLSRPPVAAQESDETSYLRKFLGLSGTTSVSLGAPQDLPGRTPLKVYLAIGLDTKVREKFSKWFDGWNRSEAKKFGAIAEVSTIGEADVVLAHVVRLDLKSTQTAGVMTGGRGLMISGDVVPITNYMLLPSDAGYKVTYRDLRQITVRYEHRVADKLWDEFKGAMKKRARH